MPFEAWHWWTPAPLIPEHLLDTNHINSREAEALRKRHGRMLISKLNRPIRRGPGRMDRLNSPVNRVAFHFRVSTAEVSEFDGRVELSNCSGINAAVIPDSTY
jgi:hypothetical protein